MAAAGNVFTRGTQASKFDTEALLNVFADELQRQSGRKLTPRGVFAAVSPAGDGVVLATGVTHSYFGHDGWQTYAPGLKTLTDATKIRSKVLISFERAEIAQSRRSIAAEPRHHSASPSCATGRHRRSVS